MSPMVLVIADAIFYLLNAIITFIIANIILIGRLYKRQSTWSKTEASTDRSISEIDLGDRRRSIRSVYEIVNNSSIGSGSVRKNSHAICRGEFNTYIENHSNREAKWGNMMAYKLYIFYISFILSLVSSLCMCVCQSKRACVWSEPGSSSLLWPSSNSSVEKRLSSNIQYFQNQASNV